MMITVAETPLFQRRASAIMSDQERLAVIDHLARNPTAGVSLGAGIRKLRFARQGGGKSGGFRVIYFYCLGENVPIFLLTAFAKSDISNLSNAEIATLKSIGKMIADTYRSRK